MYTQIVPRYAMQTGWREGNTVLNEQLKALRPRGRNSLANTILNAFKYQYVIYHNLTYKLIYYLFRTKYSYFCHYKFVIPLICNSSNFY
uniref:Transposase n=1 Tax=Heterorhabditis bacteriophora TaxID=37862 RepID=A0A1I7W8I9_HETBA